MINEYDHFLRGGVRRFLGERKKVVRVQERIKKIRLEHISGGIIRKR